MKITLPLPPSVNHYYLTTRAGKRIMTGEAKEWMDEARLLVRLAARDSGWTLVEQGKVIMGLWVYWPDRRRRDTHNLHKALADAPEGILYADDRQVLMRDMDFTVDRENPRVVVAIEEAKP